MAGWYIGGGSLQADVPSREGRRQKQLELRLRKTILVQHKLSRATVW
jgi:hypothetical protein